MNIYNFYETQKYLDADINNSHMLTVDIVKKIISILNKMDSEYKSDELKWMSSKGGVLKISVMDPKYINNCIDKIHRDYAYSLLAKKWISIFITELKKRSYATN